MSFLVNHGRGRLDLVNVGTNAGLFSKRHERTAPGWTTVLVLSNSWWTRAFTELIAPISPSLRPRGIGNEGCLATPSAEDLGHLSLNCASWVQKQCRNQNCGEVKVSLSVVGSRFSGRMIGCLTFRLQFIICYLSTALDWSYCFLFCKWISTSVDTLNVFRRNV